MAISTFGELKTAIANWLLRSDLTARIPEYVSLAETIIAYGHDIPGQMTVEPLRVRAMEATADVTVSTGTGNLPSGYLQARRVYLDSNPIRDLEFIPPMDFYGRRGNTEAGTPSAYTIEGESILTLPITDVDRTIKMLYYKKFDALDADSDTNWLLSNAPGVYLYTSLYEAYGQTEGASAEALGYLAKSAAIMNALNSADTKDRYSGAPMRARVDWTP